MYSAITKYDINRLRLSIIKGQIIDQYDTIDEFRRAVYPQIKLNTFRQWFKKPYYISDQRLCNMEQALGISEQTLTSRLTDEFDLSIDALRKAKGIQLST
ncbi:hypothetical protein [Fodinibius sediminis]|uniref:Uncharacterized protein n=1 Tax=Fodinibius sediminis TaxID=1214077 RepID=A0A521ECN2_9BACT|nr:hypothetical protein [Fodinibius sediminis]SMO81675.1 hypothetical protein SAMN06265218_1159 [Fodinibius sediminis]